MQREGKVRIAILMMEPKRRKIAKTIKLRSTKKISNISYGTIGMYYTKRHYHRFHVINIVERSENNNQPIEIEIKFFVSGVHEVLVFGRDNKWRRKEIIHCDGEYIL